MPKTKNPPALPPTITPAGELIFVAAANLKTHPRNMRRIYPPADVRQMADSIKAYGGLVQPLQLMPDSGSGLYYVVDGNLRLAAARLLGAECPPLKAEVKIRAQAEQLLEMVIANTIRFDPDPISEALHYQQLKSEGLTHEEICERTGVYYQRVLNRLALLKLEQPIQDLIQIGEFPCDPRVANALLDIPDSTARVKLAQQLAKAKANIRVILSACAKLTERLAQPVEVTADLANRPPMLKLARQQANRESPAEPVTVPMVRQAARSMCAACEINAQQLHFKIAEPAWTLLARSAGQTCGDCNLRELNLCAQCPGVELLRRVLGPTTPEVKA